MSNVWEVEFLNKADPWEVDFLNKANSWEISMNSFAQVQSDWLQFNDEGFDFIKNRTHYLKVYDDSIYTEVVTEEQNVYYMLRDWSKKNTESLIDFFTADKLHDMTKNTNIFFQIEASMNYNGVGGKGVVNLATLKGIYLDSYNYYADFGQARFYFVLNREVLMGGYKDVFPSNGIYVTKYADYYTSFGCTLGWISPLDQRYIPKTIARKEDLDGLASEKYVDDAVGAIDIPEQLQADWNQSDEAAKDFIKNKPTNLTTKEDLNKAIEEIDLSGYATETFVEEKIAEAELNKEEIDLSGYALKTELPTKISQLENDSNYLTDVPEGYVKSLSDLGITATATELNYVDGVKSSIQSQLNNKMQSNNPVYSGIIVHQLSQNLEPGSDSVTFSVGGIASGPNAFAEGASTQAYGAASHSEGNHTIARGQASHAEGYRTKVKADSRGGHAEGIFTIATAPGQHAQGSANVEDEDQIYAHIVGNGSDEENRSNAYALDWQGNGWFAGDVYVGSTSGIDKDEGSKKLATEDLVAQKTQVQIITWGADD